MQGREPFLLLDRFPTFQFGEKYVIPLGDQIVESDLDPREFPSLLEFLEQELPHLELGPSKYVTTLVLFPTTRCNLRCVYCLANAREMGDDMSSETARVAVDWYLNQLPAKQAAIIAFHSNGEPTLRMDLIRETVNYVEASRELQGSLVTNGTAPVDDYLWLLDKGFGITFSIDGPPDIQDLLRPACGGKHNRRSSPLVEKSIRACTGLNASNVVARATVTRNTLPRIPEIIKYFASLGVKRASFVGLRCIGRASNAARLAPSAMEAAKMIIDGFDVGRRLGVSIGSIMELFNYGCYRCGSVEGAAISVQPTGQVVACLEVCPGDALFDDYCVGCVDKASHDVLLVGDKIAALRRLHNVENLPECAKCYAKYFCRGGCPTEAQRSSGRILGVSAEECAFSQAVFPEIVRRVWEQSRNESAS